MQKLLTTLSLVCLVAIAGCSGAPEDSVSSTDATAPAFRVRSDITAPLAADEGWAGPQNTLVTVAADRPFRLRMEIEAPYSDRSPSEGLPLKLQFRRNGGPWTDVEAHDFPYPSRVHEIEFSGVPEGEMPPGWRLWRGSAQAFVVSSDAQSDRVLAPRVQIDTLATLETVPWEIDEFEFGATVRLDDGPVSDAASGGFSMLFGFQDIENHWRATLTPTAGIEISRLVDGRNTILHTQPAEIPIGRWFEIEVAYEDDNLGINLDDDALEFFIPLDTSTAPAGEFGLGVPAGTAVDFRDLRVEGEPSTPRVSIVGITAYTDGDATTDLLQGSVQAFLPGVGLNLNERTPPWPFGQGHGEFEWPLVIRHFADRAETNAPGDRFEFRMAAAGAPEDETLIISPVAEVHLDIPPGHLGGTFVETPGRIGPWQATDGSLYFIMEPAESDNLFMVVKSTDEGRSWAEVDGAGRPATGDLESVDARLVDGTLHILHQITEATYYHAFATADHPAMPDRWLLTDELATSVIAVSQMATLEVRDDGSLVTVHLGDTLGYNIRTPEGAWREQILIDPDSDTPLVGPQAVRGRDDAIHLAYVRLDGTVHHRRLLADGRLTPAIELAKGAGTREADYGAVLPLVYHTESDTVVIVYRLEDGHLWERRLSGNELSGEALRVTDRHVITDAADSQQPAADLVLDGSTLHALFIDPQTRSIHYTCRPLKDGSQWQPSRVVVDGILGSWVRGSIYTRQDGTRVYGFVYDAGSYGGAGMNRFAEVTVAEACGN